jgi:Site-specific recombinase XerD
MEQKIDKDYLFKTIVRLFSEEFDFNGAQMNKSLEILTLAFADIDFVSSKHLLSTEKCKNSIILKNFQGCKLMQGTKQTSVSQYIRSIQNFIKFTQKDLICVVSDDVRKYLLYYERHVSKTTADNCRRNLNILFQFMEDEGYILKNPIKKIPKIKDDIRYKRFYTDMEIESIRDACETQKELALVDLLASTGLRVSEVSNILLSEISWDERTIIIHGKGGKDRVVPISIRCKKHLQEYLLQRGINISPYLFCSTKKPFGKMCSYSINKILHAVGGRVGLPDITVHCFRRWFATTLNKRGADLTVIQDIMGHASFETTQKHYLDKSVQKIQRVYDLYVS